jgi:hypothetical protein
MTKMKHKACLATMIPETLDSASSLSSAGKALAWESVPRGGLSAPEKTVTVDLEQ